MSGLAHEGMDVCVALRLQQAEIAAIRRNVKADMAHAGSRIAGRPGQFVPVGAGDTLHGQGRRGGDRVDGLGHLVGQIAGAGVVVDLCDRDQPRAIRDPRAGRDRVGHRPGRVVAGQQARPGGGDLAGVGVDGLDQPGGGAAGHVDTGGQAQHVAKRAGQVQVGLEQGAVLRRLDDYVAQPQRPQTEAARIEIRVKLGRDAQLLHRLAALCVAEAYLEGQARIGRDDLVLAIALRPQHRRVAVGGLQLFQEPAQVQRAEVRGREVGPDIVDHVLARQRREDVERLEERRVGQAKREVVCIRQGRHRNVERRHVLARADVVAGDIGQQGVVIAVPFADLGEKGDQVSRRAEGVGLFVQQDAHGQGAEQADNFAAFTGRGRLSVRAQDAGGFQRGQVSAPPGGGVARDRGQRALCLRVGQDRIAQAVGLGQLQGDEFIARQRCGSGEDVELKRGVQTHSIVQHLDTRIAEDEVEDRVHIRKGVRPGIQRAVFAQLGIGIVEVFADLFEIPVHQRLKHWVGLNVEAEGGQPAGRQVIGETGRQHVSGRVRDRSQIGPGHVATGIRRRVARQVCGEFQEGQVIDAFRLSHVRRAEGEMDIGRVDIREVLKRQRVIARLSDRNDPRAAEGQTHLVLDRPFDQHAVGFHRGFAVGVDDLDIVEPALCPREVEDRHDAGAIQDLLVDRQDTGDAGPGQAQNGPGGKAGAFHNRGHVAPVTDAILADIGDLEGQYFRQQGDVLVGVADITDEDVIFAGQGAADGGLLHRAEGRVVDRVVIGAGGQAVILDEDLQLRVRVVRGDPRAQGLSQPRGHAVKPLLTRCQVNRSGASQRDIRRGDIDRGLGRGQVVRGRAVLVHFVAYVAAHDEPVGAFGGHGHRRGQGAGIAFARG